MLSHATIAGHELRRVLAFKHSKANSFLEIRKIRFWPNSDEIPIDLDSEWLGFSDQNEANAVCRLYLANEQ